MIRYLPDASVTARPATRPPSKNTSITWRAGSVQGCSTTQTGVIGPRVTVPRRPLCEGVACAPVATRRTTAATRPSAFTSNRV